MNIEPRHDVRGFAGECRQFYVAFISAGFTPEQAMELVSAMLMSGAARHRSDGDG